MNVQNGWVSMKTRTPIPGADLLHPVVVVSIGLLVLNDHVLKWRYPGWWTGKLSDFAGLVFFPLLLRAGWELCCAALGRFRGRSNRALLASVLLTGAVFSLIQVTAWGAYGYRWGLGALQALVQGRWHQVWSPILVRHWADPTDLLALPALGLALWIGWTQTPKGTDPTSEPSATTL